MQIQSNDEIQKFLPVNSPDQFFWPGDNPEVGEMEGHHLAKVGQLTHSSVPFPGTEALHKKGKCHHFGDCLLSFTFGDQHLVHDALTPMALLYQVSNPANIPKHTTFCGRLKAWGIFLLALSCLYGTYTFYAMVGSFIGEGDGTPLQYSCLENPMDRGAWWAAVHGVAEGQTQLSNFTYTFHFHALEKEMATHSSVLAWRIPGTGEPGGLPSVGSHRV